MAINLPPFCAKCGQRLLPDGVNAVCLRCGCTCGPMTDFNWCFSGASVQPFSANEPALDYTQPRSVDRYQVVALATEGHAALANCLVLQEQIRERFPTTIQTVTVEKIHVRTCQNCHQPWNPGADGDNGCCPENRAAWAAKVEFDSSQIGEPTCR
jgi:hypothetical protein